MIRFMSLTLTLLLLFSTADGQNRREFSEYEVKAAFLFSFIKFVDWPSNAFDDADEPLIIGIVGKDPFGSTLDAIVAGKTIKNRRLTIRRFRDASRIGRCHVLFVGSSARTSTARILRSIRNRHILTVGDAKHFARQGGMINFFTRNRRVRFQINLSAVEKSGLKISSRLLRLADIIKE